MANRFAKTSAEHIYRLDSSNWIPIMGGRDVGELWGMASERPSASRRMSCAPSLIWLRDDLAAWFGPTVGPRLRVLARGGSSRTDMPQPWLARSKSRPVTFPSDLPEPDAIRDEVAAIARELSAEITADGRQATQTNGPRRGPRPGPLTYERS